MNLQKAEELDDKDLEELIVQRWMDEEREQEYGVIFRGLCIDYAIDCRELKRKADHMTEHKGEIAALRRQQIETLRAAVNTGANDDDDDDDDDIDDWMRKGV